MKLTSFNFNNMCLRYNIFRKLRINSILFSNLSYKAFNSNIPTKPQDNSVSKTPEEQKIDNLMSQWPEYIRNPNESHLDLIELKKNLEYFYKYYQGNKGGVYSWEIPPDISNITNTALTTSLTNTTLVDCLELYEGFLQTKIIFEKFEHVCSIGDNQRSTYSVVIPIIKHHMEKFDRNDINEIYNAVSGACKINLSDNEFWNIVDNKLVGEKLFKYLSIEQCVKISNLLIKAEKGSSNLIKALEVNIIKHRRAVYEQKELLKIAKNAFNNIGSDILKASLEDPSIDVPGIDANIPEMLRKIEYK